MATHSKFARRVLAIFLTVILSLSLVNVTAFATDATSGTVVKQGTAQTNTDNTVSVQKTATKTGENTFQIQLSVTVSDKVSEETQAGTKAHIVLVIDTSGSMNSSRMASAKSAATTFVSTVLGDSAAAGNQVGVVTYSKNATTHIGLSTSETAVNNVINGIGKEDDGGTNIQAGLAKAQSMLTAGHGSDAKDIILLLSDGVPTYSNKGTSTTTTGANLPSITRTWHSTGLFSGYYTYNRTGTYNFRITNFNSTVKGSGSDWMLSDDYSISSKTVTDNVLPTLSQAYLAKAAGMEIYTVLLMDSSDDEYAVANHVMSNVATNSNHYMSTGDLSDLADLFTDVSTTITTPTNAGIVTDPMGPNYILWNNSISDSAAASYNAGTKILSWNTSLSTPTSASGKKTYTLTYSVKLDTSAASFVENTAYPTNGTTTFNYTSGGTARTIDFDVPAVSGVRPTVAYTVNYYKQGDYAHYTLADSSTKSAKLYSTVSLAAIDSGYASKYAGEYYTVARHDDSLLVNAAGLSLNVYYNHETATVTVNHFLKTNTYAADGTYTAGTDYAALSSDQVTATVNKGASYTAALLTDPSYTFVEADSDARTISSVTGNSIINLYYVTTIDNRATASVNVYHKYNTYQWVLQDGIYVKQLVEGTPTFITSDTSGRATTQYSASTADVTMTDGTYTYKPESATAVNGTTPLTVTESSGTVSFYRAAGANTLTLTFVKDVPAPPNVSTANIQVTHHYTKDVVTVDDNGAIQHDTTAHSDVVESIPVTGTYYQGETRTVTADQTQPGGTGTDTYAVSGDASKTVTLNAGTNEVTFDYTLTSAPAQTTVKVNHIYRTMEEYTDADGATQTREITDKRTTDSQTIQNVYVGQKVDISLRNVDGYTFNSTESDSYSDVRATAGNETVINLYYDTTEDNRDTATLTVTHSYYVNLDTVQNGVETQVRQSAGTGTPDPYTGKVGDSYPTIDVRTVYDGKTYTRTDTSSLDGTFGKTAATINLVYERSDSDRVSTTYTANYYYYDWDMTVVDGVAGYYSGSSCTLADSTPGTAQTSSVGVAVTLNSGARSGYTAAAANPSTSQTLTNGENVYNFYFYKYNPLSTINVDVTHSYKLTTISSTGGSSDSPSSQSGSATPSPVYVGADVHVDALCNGYTLNSVTVMSGGQAVTYTQNSETGAITFPAPSADAAVQFNYSKTVDNSISASYTIQHWYRTKDWDGTYSDYVLDTQNGQSGNSYATLTVTAPKDTKNGAYVFDNYTVTGGSAEASGEDAYTLTLGAGSNVLKLYYTKEIDTRTATVVQVTHIYRVADANTTLGYVDEGSTVETLSTVAQGAYVGNTFTATPITSYSERTYTVQSASPEGYTMTLAAATQDQPNEITIYYTRGYGANDLYSVWGTKTYEGLPVNQIPATTIYLVQSGERVYSATVDGNGQFLFENVAPGVYTFDEDASVSNYTYSAQYALTTYSNDEESGSDPQTVSSITVNEAYSRAESSLLITNAYTYHSPYNPPSSTSYTLTVQWVDESGTALASPVTRQISEGSSYNAANISSGADRTFDGYTYSGLADDSAAISGYMTGDKTVTFVYDAVSDINEPATPLSGNPTEESTDIPADEVPLAQAPQTGDQSAVWIAVAALSASGIIWIFVSNKKRKDDATN